MSCWRNYTCDALKNVNKKKLKEALAEMNLELNESKKTVYASYENQEGKVDGVLVKNGQELELGLIIDGENHCVQVLGDFWRTGLNEVNFNNDLGRIYQRINMIAQLQLSGYTIENVEETADGGIEIEAYAWA